jgi:hypothetical protein
LSPRAPIELGVALGLATWLAVQASLSVEWTAGHAIVSALPFLFAVSSRWSKPGWPFHGRATARGTVAALASLPPLFIERTMHDGASSAIPEAAWPGILVDLPLLIAVFLVFVLMDRGRGQAPSDARAGPAPVR